MKNKLLFRCLKSALASLLLNAPLAYAHSVWIEDTTEKQLVIRFGEFLGKTEKSPGHLDSLSLPVAWKFAEEGKALQFVVGKKSEHFLLVDSSPGSPALAEADFSVMKRGSHPASWPHFYVRWQPAGGSPPAAPALTLDILPAATAGEFQVFFRGQPLSQAAIIVHGQAKEDEIKTDAEGRFKFVAPSGLVLLTSNHKEQIAGFAGGTAYEVSSHNTALT